MSRSTKPLVCLALVLLATQLVSAHPEYQDFVRRTSGRNVNCAMCHAHADGPDGLKPGQVGSLGAEELLRLGEARAAFDPGVAVESPILNDFGNHLVQRLGKKKLLELRARPEALAEVLGSESDLDDDGIPDSLEYLQGTHPLSAEHGDPWLLFTTNLRRNAFHLIMIVLATGFGLFGLNHVLQWFAHITTSLEEDEDATDAPRSGEPPEGDRDG